MPSNLSANLVFLFLRIENVRCEVFLELIFYGDNEDPLLSNRELLFRLVLLVKGDNYDDFLLFNI